MRASRRQRKHLRTLCQIEPRLKELYERAKAVKDDPASSWFCPQSVWGGYTGLRAEMTALVGWHAKTQNPMLRTCEAYMSAYRVIYGALPRCRNCTCIGVAELMALRAGAQ